MSADLEPKEVVSSQETVVPVITIDGPSGSGKSILLQNMILDIYEKCFSRIYIFSPSINVDYQTWEPVKKL